MAHARVGDTIGCTYHSPEWMALCETGWVTKAVRDGYALMLKVR